MKTVAIASVITVLIGTAVTQEQNTPQVMIAVPICELIRHPEKYDGKTVQIRARLRDHWEMGPRLTQENCKKFVYFTYPDGPELPAAIAMLRMNEDPLTSDFREKRKALCNGSDTMCDFSVVAADFTGVFVSQKRLSNHWDAPVLVVTGVGQAKWTRNCDKSPPPVIHESPCPKG